MNSRSKSRCLYVFHLFVDANERIFRIQYAQKFRSWIVIRNEWINYKALLIKNEFKIFIHILNKLLISSSSRMKKKKKQKLKCESHETSKIFSKRRIKNCIIVWRFEIVFMSNLCWLFRCNFKSQHDMYEDMKSLFANSILFLLTIVLTNRVFQNYAIFKEIKKNFSFANKFLHHLRIKKNIFRVFFFK